MTIPLIPGVATEMSHDDLLILPRNMTQDEVLTRFVELYTAADKYDVQGLVEHVCSKLQDVLNQQLCPPHKSAPRIWSSRAIVDLLEAAYTSTVSRSPLRQAIVKHVFLKMDLKEFLEDKESSDVLLKFPDMLLDLLKVFLIAMEPCKCSTQPGVGLVRELCISCDGRKCNSEQAARIVKQFSPFRMPTMRANLGVSPVYEGS